MDTLGSYGGDGSAIYHFEYTFPHWQEDLELEFSGIGPSSLNGEFWGLDNVDVRFSVLEPDGPFSYVLGDSVSDGVPASGAGNIEVPRGRDEYTFTVPAGGLEVYVDWQACFGWMQSLLLNSSEEVLNENCTDGFLTLPQGAYTLKVYSAGEQYGTYQFRISEVAEGDGPFAYDIGETVSDGVPAAGAGNIEDPGGLDEYTFTVPAGGLEVYVDWQACFGWMQSLLLNSSEEVLNEHCTDGFLTLPQGVYTLKVYSAGEQYGTYQFQISET